MNGKNYLIRNKFALISIAVIFILAIAFLFGNTKSGIFLTVKSNQSELTHFAEGLLQSDRTISVVHYKHKNWKIYRYSDHVDFIVTAFGLAPSTVYKGFYYSPSDSLVGFQGANHIFTEYGDGWIYREDDGDNTEYLEKIADNWYWFEMYF